MVESPFRAPVNFRQLMRINTKQGHEPVETSRSRRSGLQKVDLEKLDATSRDVGLNHGRLKTAVGSLDRPFPALFSDRSARK